MTHRFERVKTRYVERGKSGYYTNTGGGWSGDIFEARIRNRPDASALPNHEWIPVKVTTIIEIEDATEGETK